MQRIRSGTAIATLTALTLGLATAGANAASSNKNLVLIQGTKADTFYVTMGCGAKAEAKKLGYNISVQGPEDFSASEQIPIVHSVTASKPAAVLIAPTDEKALIAPMQAGGGTRIKVLEAAAFGVATVASFPAAAGLFTPRQPWGWICRHPSDFAAACADALSDPRERDRRGKIGYRSVTRQYSRDVVVPRLAALLQECCG